jgi:hypothetical protein
MLMTEMCIRTAKSEYWSPRVGVYLDVTEGGPLSTVLLLTGRMSSTMYVLIDPTDTFVTVAHNLIPSAGRPGPAST